MSLTIRERMLAVMQGRPHDRVPFIQYDDALRRTRRSGKWPAARYGDPALVAAAPYRPPAPQIRGATYPAEGLKGKVRTLHTPAGDLTEEVHYEPT